MRSFTVTAILLALSQTAAAADSKGNFVGLGTGTKSCGTVVRDYQERGASFVANNAWVNGYLTAINRYVYRGGDITENIDLEGRNLWIHNYCTQNPLSNLVDATGALVSELLRRSR